MKKPNSFSDEVLRAWLARDASSVSIDEWMAWNNSPLRHVPLATVVQIFPEPFYQALLKAPEDVRVITHVNALLKLKFSWKEPVAWAPDDALWQVSMMAPSRFERLALLSSALSMHQAMTQIIDGSLVRKLRQQLGEDIVQFVLLGGSCTKYLLEPMNSELAALDDIVAAIKQGAITIVEHAFSSKEKGIQQRIASKLPGCFAKGCCDAPLPWAAATEKILSELWKETSSWI